MTWLDDAACRSYNPDAWFSDTPDDSQVALMVCRVCPVAAECEALWRSLPAALRKHGIWAGRHRAVPSCGDVQGTRAGIQRHERRGERLCPACREARNEHLRARRARRAERAAS